MGMLTFETMQSLLTLLFVGLVIILWAAYADSSTQTQLSHPLCSPFIDWSADLHGVLHILMHGLAAVSALTPTCMLALLQLLGLNALLQVLGLAFETSLACFAPKSLC